jgi:DNA mismatch repair ATPase MutS
MTIIDEYLYYQEKYEKTYGKNKVVVLYQNGSFHEIYGTETRGCDLKVVTGLLNIILTRKDKSINKIDETNPFMAGFPTVSLGKYLKILIDNDYTVIVVDQTTPPPNPKREITGIYSPGTHIAGEIKPDSNNIISIYIEEEKQLYGNILLCIGLSMVDLSTGESKVYEVHSSMDDSNYALDEAHRFIINASPKEIIFQRKKEEKVHLSTEKISSYLDFGKKLCYSKEGINKNFLKVSYQSEFLNKIYPDTGMLNTIEYLDMEKMPYAVISFIILLDFAKQHKENIIKDLAKPEIYDNKKYLILGNDAVNQLNVFDDNDKNIATKFKSLFDVINNTSTAMGRRYLKNILSNPLTSCEIINKYNGYIGILINNKLYSDLETNLKEIIDLERFYRKLSLSILHPYELYNFGESIRRINNILKIAEVLKLDIKVDDKLVNKFLEDFDKIFLMDELKKQNLTEMVTSIFKIGHNKEIDKCQKSIDDALTFMEIVCSALSEYIPDSKFKKKLKNEDNNEDEKDIRKIYLKNNERDGYFLKMTKIRADNLKKNIKDIEKIKITNDHCIKPTDLMFKELESGGTKVFFTELTKQSKNIVDAKDELKELMKKEYINVLEDITKKYGNLFKTLAKYVGFVDYLVSGAMTAKKYNYVKPIACENEKSYIKCEDLRHPIVERIKMDTEYVPHSLSLGNYKKDKENDDDKQVINCDGMLIHGINAAGKCFKKDTPILLYNGIIKQAQHIKQGDQLMGDDSRPRNVLSTTKGTGQMYKINAATGDSFICNGPHILCLKNLKNNLQIIEISVDDYLNKSSSWKADHYLYKIGVEFQERPIELDPYILGYWLINSIVTYSKIRIDDPKVIKYCKNNNLNLEKSFTSQYNTESKNNDSVLDLLYGLNVINNKHIPDIYKTNSRKIRLAVLAGIIDAFGSNNNIFSKDKQLIEDIIYLSRSLGFSANMEESCNHFELVYYSTAIYGDNLKDIPVKTKITYYNEPSDMIPFEVEKLYIDEYVGFQVDGNNRFLLGDFTVTHNSTLMKSIGLNTIMAQCGLYVAAKKFEFSPYTSLYARITGNDNIFKGLSSFTLEMTELKAILKRASKKTLVIGDEVCRGTEHISGNAIVAATIIELAQSGSTFIFATHLHEIAQMERIKILKNLKIFHLSVDYDAKNDVLIFNRELRPGQGDMIYGLKIAEHILVNNKFIKLANEIKNELLNTSNQIMIDKQSKYNANVYIDKCAICEKQVNEQNILNEFDTHHINFQKDCKDGFVATKPHIPMNSSCNLVVLCKECHKKVHHGKLEIKKFIDTSKGKKIDFMFK